ncbi:hypothetical protein ILYODFUR_017144 [Ilyodon furcidens]|uniref:Uncharacterized protein n=1 Tax=Ilyodon furcidens TaxID=33524 RepID=A0ABV0U932_9TELE
MNDGEKIPREFGFASSWQLPVLFVPEPSHKRTLSTLQRKPPHIELVYGNLSSTEQHQVNSLRIYLLKTWILNLLPPGNLTIITHEIFRPFRS